MLEQYIEMDNYNIFCIMLMFSQWLKFCEWQSMLSVYIIIHNYNGSHWHSKEFKNIVKDNNYIQAEQYWLFLESTNQVIVILRIVETIWTTFNLRYITVLY